MTPKEKADFLAQIESLPDVDLAVYLRDRSDKGENKYGELVK